MSRLARWAAIAGYLGAAAVLVYAIAVRIAFRMLGNPDEGLRREHRRAPDVTSVPSYPARAPWGDQ